MAATEGFMSLEVHAMWPVAEAPIDGDVPEADIHLSFTAEYSIGTAGQLVTATIIGSYIDDQTGLVSWERPGYLREYRMTLRGNQLELSWGTEGEGTNRMVFKPRRPRRPLSRNISARRWARRCRTAGATSSAGARGRPASAMSSDAKPAGEARKRIDPPAGKGREDGDR